MVNMKENNQLNPIGKISNNVYIIPSPNEILERQMISYMNIFRNIADQISDLNQRIDNIEDAAE